MFTWSHDSVASSIPSYKFRKSFEYILFHHYVNWWCLIRVYISICYGWHPFTNKWNYIESLVKLIKESWITYSWKKMNNINIKIIMLYLKPVLTTLFNTDSQSSKTFSNVCGSYSISRGSFSFKSDGWRKVITFMIQILSL